MTQTTHKLCSSEHGVTRRTAIGTSLACLALSALSLTGCGASKDFTAESPDTVQTDTSVQDAADASQDVSQESQLPAEAFDGSIFTVPDAFDTTFDDVLSRVQQTVPDAVTVAVRFASAIEPGVTPDWDYLLASQDERAYYVAFTQSDVTVARMGSSFVKGTEWGQIPSTNDVKIDAAQAYALACEAAQQEAMPKAVGLYAFLTLYSEPAGEADPTYDYEDAGMTWYFDFNYLIEAPATQADAKVPNTDNAQSTDTDEKLKQTRGMYCVAVDATSGQTTIVAR